METNKYSDIEIQTAKRLYDAGYKWLVKEKYGELFACSEKLRKTEAYWEGGNKARWICVSGKLTSIFQDIKWEDDEPTYIEYIINPPILDDAEKRYLKGVIRPFRDKVRSVSKQPKLNGREEYIVIDIGLNMFFPSFKSNTMYKGMDLCKEYRLKELGL